MSALRWWAGWVVGAFATVVVGFVLLIAAAWLAVGGFLMACILWSLITRGVPW